MIEYYAPIKLVHIVCVILSGSLFSLRGLFMLAGAAAPAQSEPPVLRRR
jgi:uncharacterized membrane protein SirB2